jgi:hypothetical protein
MDLLYQRDREVLPFARPDPAVIGAGRIPVALEAYAGQGDNTIDQAGFY